MCCQRTTIIMYNFKGCKRMAIIIKSKVLLAEDDIYKYFESLSAYGRNNFK